MIAIDKGHDTVCEVLLKHGASLLEVDCSGLTALEIAMRWGHAPVLSVLQKWSVPTVEATVLEVGDAAVTSSEDIFGFDTWEAELAPESSNAPHATLEIVETIVAALDGLHGFVPDFNDEAEWDIVDISLPEIFPRVAKLGRLDVDSLAHLSACISGAIEAGYVSLSELRSVAGHVRGERQDELCTHMQIVLCDVGVEVHPDLPPGWPESFWPIDEAADDSDQQSDILQFLGDLSVWRNNPMSGLEKDARRWSKLDRSDELKFGQQRDELVKKLGDLIDGNQVLREKAREISASNGADDSFLLESSTFGMPSNELSRAEDDDLAGAAEEDEALVYLAVDALSVESSGGEGECEHQLEDNSRRVLYDPALVRFIAADLDCERFKDFFQIRDSLSALFDRFISSNLGLVHFISRRYGNLGLDYSDLFQEGCIGLMRAAVRFDHHRGFKFSTFATWWIRQAVSRAIGDQSRMIRVPVHMHEKMFKLEKVRRQMSDIEERSGLVPALVRDLDLSDAEVRKILAANIRVDEADEDIESLARYHSAPAPGPSPVEILDQVDFVKVAGFMLSELSPREARILRLRFGIDGEESMTLEEVGKLYDVTRERIRQIEAKAMRKLRHPSRSERVRDLLGPKAPSPLDEQSSDEEPA